MTLPTIGLNLQQPDGQSATPAPQTPAPQVPGQQPPAQGNQQIYVTKEELQQEMAKVIANSQSAVGKSEARINQKIQELQKAGIQATPQQAAKALELEDARQVQGSQPQPQGQQPVQPQIQPTGDPVIDQARAWLVEDGIDTSQPDAAPIVEVYRMMAQAGVRMTDEDPETKEINAKGSYLEFLQSAKAAIDKIAARTKAQGSPARIPGLVQGQHNTQPDHIGKSGRATLESAYQEYMPK